MWIQVATPPRNAVHVVRGRTGGGDERIGRVPDGAGQRARVGTVERLGVFGDLGLDRLGHFGDGCVGLQAEGPSHVGCVGRARAGTLPRDGPAGSAGPAAVARA